MWVERRKQEICPDAEAGGEQQDSLLLSEMRRLPKAGETGMVLLAGTGTRRGCHKQDTTTALILLSPILPLKVNQNIKGLSSRDVSLHM